MKGQRINGVEIITQQTYKIRHCLVYANGRYAGQPAPPNAVKGNVSMVLKLLHIKPTKHDIV